MHVSRIADAARFDRAKLVKTNLFESERMFCDVYAVSPGQEQKPHAHDGCDKIYVVIEGRGTFRVGAETQEVGAGHAVLASSGEEHSVKNATDAPLLLLVFMAPHPNYVRKTV